MRRVGERNSYRHIALIGNPNSGKTTVFNALTGLRQKVGNYPGVTVEKKEGRILFRNGTEGTVLDLPGTYSLAATSPDEQIATDVLLGRAPQTPRPELVVCVVDASNLERGLYLASQIIDRHVPLVVALNMIDVAADQGIVVNAAILEHELGVRVVPMVARKEIGVDDLKQAMLVAQSATGKERQWRLPEPVQRECEELECLLHDRHSLAEADAFYEAMALLTADSALIEKNDRYAPELLQHVRKDHQKLDFLGINRSSVFFVSRSEWIKRLCAQAVTRTFQPGMSLSDRIDRVVTHRFWGIVMFLVIMAVLFQTIFSWATIPMAWIKDGFDGLGGVVAGIVPPGDLQDLLIRGGLAGVAAVVTFLPQILFLFLFLGFLEDSGYMARAAFIMDRLMGKVGLHGKSFIPLLSSFACAIPGIMATRTIDNPKDRLATMLVAPLMSCSARLPVYALLIAAFIPSVTVLGFFSLAGVTLLSMYLLGLVAALSMAWIFKNTLLRGTSPSFLMELPPYKLPSLKSVFYQMWERAASFLKRAGTIILGASILLWFLASYPRLEHATPAAQLNYSFAGRAGHLIEPVIRPLGFDWKIGIGLVSSLLQREVFVSTMGTIYNIQNAASPGPVQGPETLGPKGRSGEKGSISLRQQMSQDRDPATGLPTFTVLTAICVMVYYVLAMQCLSTVAVMRRETNGWKWPMFQVGYMTALAYVVTFIVYRAGLWLGAGGS
jgi:ferrous iron transport protein B